MYGQWQPLGQCPPRLGQKIHFRVGSNDLTGPVTPSNEMAIRMMGIWKTESTIWTPNITDTGTGGGRYSTSLSLVMIIISICRHKYPTHIRIRVQDPTLRWQCHPTRMKAHNSVPVQWWMWWTQGEVSHLTSPSQVKLVISLPLHYWMPSHWGQQFALLGWYGSEEAETLMLLNYLLYQQLSSSWK